MRRRLALSSVLLLTALGSPLSASFQLGPHRTVLCNVPVGKRVEADPLGTRLMIVNQNPFRQTYMIEIKRPSDVKRDLLFGYEELPKAKFVSAQAEVTVDPGASAPVKFWADIPAEERYYNRKWEAEVSVKEKSGGVGVELQGQLWIETAAKPQAKTPRPREGTFILAPATLDLKGFKSEAHVRLYNVSKSSLSFLIVSASPPEKVKDMFLPYSEGFARLEDQEWITPSVKGEERIKRIKEGREIAPQKRIAVEPGSYKTIDVAVDVPAGKENAGRKESFLFVRCPELNMSKFVRIRLSAP